MTALTAEQLAEIKMRSETESAWMNANAFENAARDRRALLAHVEALERDAGRYRWLRSQAWVFIRLERDLPDVEYGNSDEQFVDDCVDLAMELPDE